MLEESTALPWFFASTRMRYSTVPVPGTTTETHEKVKPAMQSSFSDTRFAAARAIVVPTYTANSVSNELPAVVI